MTAGGSGASVTALHVAAADVFSPDAGTSARCQMTFTTVGPAVDPTPANDAVTIELDVYDDSDR